MKNKTNLVNDNFTKFLAPRYWATWLGLGITRLAVMLPHRQRLALGRWLGRTLGSLIKSRRRTIATNLKLCFPELTNPEREQLIYRHLESLGMGMIETAMSWWLNDDELSALAIIEGAEYLRSAQANGYGVILFTGHFTSLELGGHLLGIHFPVHAMYRQLRNYLADSIVLQGRSRRSPKLYARDDIRSMVRDLKKGAIVWYAMDQDQGGAQAIFAPFFGVPAATLTTTSRLAKLTGALVIPYWPTRLPDGRYRIRILPALDNFPSDPAQDAIRLNALLEEWIKQTPEQYLWVHRRFKTRPAGMLDFYKTSNS